MGSRRPLKLQIKEVLEKNPTEEFCVKDFENLLGANQSAVSKALMRGIKGVVIRRERKGRSTKTFAKLSMTELVMMASHDDRVSYDDKTEPTPRKTVREENETFGLPTKVMMTSHDDRVSHDDFRIPTCGEFHNFVLRNSERNSDFAYLTKRYERQSDNRTIQRVLDVLRIMQEEKD